MKRSRPSLLSLGFSVAIAVLVSYLIVLLFAGLSYLPLSVAALTAVAAYLYRSRRLKGRIPRPHGEGRSDTIGAGEMTRSGLLLVAGGFLIVVLPLTTLFFAPLLFFILYLAFPLGFALSEILQFTWITRIEGRAGAEVFSLTERTEIDGKEAIIKSAALIPKDKHD